MTKGDSILVTVNRKEKQGEVVKVKQNAKGETILEFVDNARRSHYCYEKDAVLIEKKGG